jgi:hypothetical protein
VPASQLAVIGFLGTVVSSVALPLASGPVLVAASMASIGIGLPALFGALANVGLTAHVVSSIPEEVLGRVSASVHVTGAAASVAGALLGGILAPFLGIVGTLWLTTGVSLAGLAFLPASVLLHPLRRLLESSVEEVEKVEVAGKTPAEKSASREDAQ